MRRSGDRSHVILIRISIFQAIVWVLLTALCVIPRATAASFAATESSYEPPSRMTTKRVVVIGGHGQTGLRTVKLLAESDRYEPVAMIRHPAQGSTFDAMGVTWFVGDLDAGNAPRPDDLEGAHAVIFAAGAGRNRPNVKKVTIDYLGAVRSIVAAQETKSVTRFVLLSGINSDPRGTRRSASADPEKGDLNGPLSAWHRLKAHSETYLRESHLHGRALNWTVLSPGRLVDDPEGGCGTGAVKCSLIHGEDDLRDSLTNEERAASIRVMPGSHDGKSERLCVSRDNVAATLVGILGDSNAIGKTITVVDGILPVDEALKKI